MAKIFIAYSREDVLFATRLAKSLSQLGADVWIDVDDIPAGEQWHIGIQEGLELCEIMLLVTTPESMTSKNVGAEWRYFYDENKPIIPVLHKFASINYQLRVFQYIDFQKQDYDKAFAQLHSELRRKGVELENLTPTNPSIAIPIQKPLPVQGRRKIPWSMIGGGIFAIIIAIIGGLASRSDIFSFTPRTPIARTETVIAQTATDEIHTSLNPVDATVAESYRQATEAGAITQAFLAPTETHLAELVALTDSAATENAIGTQVAARMATDTTWTPTSTMTSTPTVTSLPTNTPVSETFESALERARNFSSRNTNWELFSYVFAGDVTDTEMVLVPVGSFMLGSDSVSADSDEVPHSQSVRQPFWIDKYEVTNADFALFLNARGNRSVDDFEYLDSDDTQARIQSMGRSWQVLDGYEQHPVTEVTWFAARDYCSWRGVRLPSELEWEYAASGVSNWEYPWGDIWDENKAVWTGNNPTTTNTALIGSIEGGVSWVGAYDMSGNVWEWVSSLYLDYEYGRDHEDLDDITTVRVLRGGSWSNYDELSLRTAVRNWSGPNYANGNYGFRCARDL